MNIVTKPGLLRNLQIGFGLSLLILIITSVASYSSISNLLDSSRWVDHTDSVINELSNTLTTLTEAEAGQRGYLLTGDTTFLQPFTSAQDRVLRNVDDIQAMTYDNPAQQQNVVELRPVLADRLTLLEKVVEQRRSDNIYNLADIEKGTVYMRQARRIIQKMQEEEHRLLTIRVEKSRKYATYTPILIIIAAFLSIIITLFFYWKVHNDYLERAALYSQLQEKDAEISRRIDIISELADQISAGNYQTRVSDEQKDNLGVLSGSLNKMAESLEYSFGLLSDKEWLQTGIARLNEEMVGQVDMKVLVSRVIEFIAGYSRSKVGAFYILDPITGSLGLTGSYALAAGSNRQTIKAGEGLVGQVAIDGKRVLVKDIPPGDWVVSFTAGGLKPRTIVAFAFFHEKKIKGVIELGSLEYYSERDLDFFNSVAENIGIAINSIESRVKLQELLEETQAQSEELQSQHSELESLNMELETQAEKLQVSEEELKVQQEELMQTNQELEERSRSLEEKNHLILLRNLDIQKKAEELAQTTKYKSEFMANMSHELRTPLNSILLLSRLLSENSGKNLSDDQIEYARVIQNSGQGLLQLIDEILDLSRIESGKLPLEHTMISMAEIVEDMQSLFRPMARDKNLELNFIIEEGTPGQLETDKMRLEQILKNLLSNAIKFTPKGSITMKISPAPERKNFVEFSVRDSGIGIPEDKHELIFEAFQQADGSTRRKYGGTGLGLSISRELSRLLGGDIRLTSESGQGAEFTVSVPRFRMDPVGEAPGIETFRATVSPSKTGYSFFTLPEAPSEIPDDRNGVSPGDKVLLIVEDDTVFAQSLLEFSRKKGYKGVVAVSGGDAMRMAVKYRPIGILLDIQLPVKSGWEVMEELKKDPRTRPIPVHIISSFEVKSESLLKGAADFLSKHTAYENMETVFEKIEYVLSRSTRKVLIVEDNTRHARALAYFLGTHDVYTEISGTVDESIALLQKEGVDGVILSREGDEDRDALEMIRQNPSLENIPVIVFTGATISKGEEARLRKYADSIVVKTAHSYQRILDEVSLFLHVVGEDRENISQVPGAFVRLGGLDEVLKDKTVLIADDDVRNIFSLTKALELHKMRVISAMDGTEALTAAEQYSPDIILMDMMMPEMDGFEAITRIRKNPRWSRLPIIAVTAKAMAGDREKCMQAGASDYISKPVDIDQLLSLLRIWLYEK